MSMCKYNECNNELNGRQKEFCSDKCRMAMKRYLIAERGKVEHKPEQTKVEHEQTDKVGQTVTGAVAVFMDEMGIELTDRIITQSMLDSLPPGVVKPQGQPGAATARQTGRELNRAVERLNPWQASSVYAEVIYRLLTLTIAELEQSSQSVPSWKERAA